MPAVDWKGDLLNAFAVCGTPRNVQIVRDALGSVKHDSGSIRGSNEQVVLAVHGHVFMIQPGSQNDFIAG